MVTVETPVAAPQHQSTNSVSSSADTAPSAASISPATGRLAFLDLLRTISAHVIVWHHLVFYGPLSDVVAPYFPRTSEFLYEYGRYAVQVFFVLGGFITAL